MSDTIEKQISELSATLSNLSSKWPFVKDRKPKIMLDNKKKPDKLRPHFSLDNILKRYNINIE